MSENTEAGGLVERLRDRAESYRMGGPSSEHTAAILDEAATTLEAQAAELSSLRIIADSQVVSHRDFNTVRAEKSESDLTAERAAHAETKRALDEALKALEPFAAVAEHDIGEDETDDDIFWPISNARYSMSGRLRVGHLRAARRVCEGGSNG